MDTTIEQDIAARASKAPRVTPADIEAAIASEHYFTAAEGVAGSECDGCQVVSVGGGPLALLTFCVLVLRNGFTVTGQSACASPENFDADIGRRVARADAVRQVWPLLGYALREKLAAQPSDYRDRVRAEAAELTERMVKLEAFFKTDTYSGLPEHEKTNLQAQYEGMSLYRRALHARIAAF